MLWPTYKATKQAVKYSDSFFGTKHHKNTPANAFRHAIWNWLIAKECMQLKSDGDKVMNWTQKITSMHEKILPGDTLSNAMDLHNNAVGRMVYFEEKVYELEKGLARLRKLTQESKKISTADDLKRYSKSQLVHLIDPQ
ncbi:MAG: hypothetical protein HKP53_08295 [Eudoraea sp.]|nr:hypothetical protein [Eudoraea sp.]